MEQGQLHDKLFRAAQQHLKDHEEAFDASDWDRMDKSLDQLPRGKQFNWSFSLNSVLVLIGLSGLALGGYALLGGNSSGENQSVPAPAVTTAPAKKEAPALTKSQPVTTQPVVTNTPATTDVPVTQPAQQAQTVADARSTDTGVKMRTTRLGQGNSKKTSETDHSDVTLPGSGSGDFSNDVVFPDMIDKREGPVYATEEDPEKLGSIPPVDPKKLTYFEENGKPIHITTDSSKGATPKRKKDRKNKSKQSEPQPEPERSLDPPSGDNPN